MEKLLNSKCIVVELLFIMTKLIAIDMHTPTFHSEKFPCEKTDMVQIFFAGATP